MGNVFILLAYYSPGRVLIHISPWKQAFNHNILYVGIYGKQAAPCRNDSHFIWIYVAESFPHESSLFKWEMNMEDNGSSLLYQNDR